MIFIGVVYTPAFGQGRAKIVDDLVRANYPDRYGPGVAVLISRADSVGQYVNSGVGNTDLQTPISSQSQFRMASVSKQFTACAIFQLIEQEKLSFATVLGNIFPDLPKAIQEITVGQLLQHTSGIWDYEPLMPANQIGQLSDSDVLDIIKGKEETYFTPGSTFRYSNTGYCLLALIVEHMTGLAYPAYIEQFIFKPSGLEDARVFEPGRDIPNRVFGYHLDNGKYIFADQSLTSATKGDGGVYISTQEFAKWIDTRVADPVKNRSYLESLVAQKVLVKDSVYYSLGWFLKWDDVGRICLFHSGESTGFHNIVYVVPGRKVKLMVFSNRDDLQIGAFFDKLLAVEKIAWNKSLVPPVSLFEWLSRVYADN
jgi:D-alanyl-D-alanine carboxypeptidase